MALIQVLSLSKNSHRSEEGLVEELQGAPKSATSWIAIAKEHPEFFRVRGTGKHRVSMIARHVLKDDENIREKLSPDFIGKLLETAIELHDRQLSRDQNWKTYIPIIVSITAGTFTIFGIFLNKWI
ncbi:hypothetical protein [Neptuniibacter sp. CAU 1671]|uniref:hypothetical protein n=1 Tax=Neptuniibacter sp. CAU 1671 TaxID=3032593 RepID=UPI0023DCA43D|nr:hypothetical protein [Neptuniibacter sp. CAU 1671]MDF2181229.1 hypothetical protein [Neptuniibacter sp. CAU 1671]